MLRSEIDRSLGTHTFLYIAIQSVMNFHPHQQNCTCLNEFFSFFKAYSILPLYFNLQFADFILKANWWHIKCLFLSLSLLLYIVVSGEIEILINVGSGQGAATAYGCDLTYDYVRINGDYRS